MANKTTKTNRAQSTSKATSGSIASKPTEQPELNQNAVTSYPKSYTIPGTGQTVNYPEIETPIKITTCTNPNVEAVHYDDVVESSVKYKVPEDFQCVYDASGQLPQWRQMTENLQDPLAVNRTAVSPVEGFHKGPNVHQFSMDEMKTISSGGVVDHGTKMPTVPADKNRF
jgi:hypothetical protein